MTVPLQSPDIPTGLRRALALDGVGSFQMDVATTVQPIVVVGDSRAQQDEEFVSYIGRVYAGAPGAGNYLRYQLSWARVPDQPIQRIEIMRLRVRSAAATQVYVGWSTPQPIGTTATIVTKQQIPAGSFSNSALQIFNDASAVVPSITGAAGILGLVAGVDNDWDFTVDPWVLREAATGVTPGLNIINATANTDLHLSVEWREYLRG